MLNTTQRKILIEAINTAIDTILVIQSDDDYSKFLAAATKSVKITSRNLAEHINIAALEEFITTDIKIPNPVREQLLIVKEALTNGTDIPVESLQFLVQHPNYNPINLADIERYSKKLQQANIPQNIYEMLMRIRETYLEMTPIGEYSYGYSTFQYRIGTVPFNLNNCGPMPESEEIQSDVRNMVDVRLDLYREYKAELAKRTVQLSNPVLPTLPATTTDQNLTQYGGGLFTRYNREGTNGASTLTASVDPNSPPVKVLIMGEIGTPKSAFLDRARTADSNGSNGIFTVGVEFISLSINDIRFHIWDTTGQERFRSISNAYMKNTQMILLMAENLQSLSYLHQKCERDTSEVRYCFIQTVENQAEQRAIDGYLAEHDITKFNFATDTTADSIKQFIWESFENHEVSHRYFERNSFKSINTDSSNLPIQNESYRSCTIQ
ncbi:MAG: ras-related protein Rab-37-like isoform [Gammaproteobacteria bacterium]|jgi:signal recognition particle receptor subunit beta|nr:ras-related protein Rab-37-like isoform [Gammaproteobacteria bacterium]